MDEDTKHLVNVVFVQKRNVFLSGSGGTGKSYSLKKLHSYAQSQGKTSFLTATTGVAAIHLGGRTFHSWAGIKLGKGQPSELVKMIMYKKKLVDRWRKAQLLIIDEISMFGAKLLDKMNFVAKSIRCNHRPFGGIQVIFSGDFLQLPPVNDDFCFKSEVWKELDFKYVLFNTPKRYPDVSHFYFLQRVRRAELLESDITKLVDRHTAYRNSPFSKSMHSGIGKRLEIEPTRLYSMKKDVEYYNLSRLDELASSPRTFLCEDRIVPLEEEIDLNLSDYGKALNNLAPEACTLKVGAQVMLTFNLDVADGLCNGSRGVVTDISDKGAYVRFLNEKTVLIEATDWEISEEKAIIVRRQVPLILAYALTIHKCVDKNTLIFTDQGLVRISELANSNQNNYTYIESQNIYVEGRKKLNEATQIYKGGKENTLKLETTLGYSITATDDHRLLVYTNQGKEKWKNVKDITTQDHLVLRCNQGSFSSKYPSTKSFVFNSVSNMARDVLYEIPDFVTEDLCYLFGLLIGDGCYSVKNNSIDYSVCNIDKELGEIYIQTFQKLFNKRDICTYNPPNKTITRYNFRSNHIRKFLQWCGLDYVKSYDKSIPKVVLQNTRECQIACLQGLFDTDGGVNKSCIHFTTTSYQLIIEIQNLLLNLGIICSIRRLKGQSRVKYHDAWRIQICGYNAHLFYQHIGFQCKRKQEALKKKYGMYTRWSKSNTCEVPGGQQLIQNFRDEVYIYYGCEKRCNQLDKSINRLISRIINNKSKLRYNHVQYIYNYFKNNLQGIEKYGPSGQHLSEMYKSNIFMDRVVSISKSKSEVYDLYVPEDHTFLGNGIVNHNCQSATLDYLIVDLGPSVFAHGQAYVALSRSRTLQGLFISNLRITSIKAHPEALAFENKLLEEDTIEILRQD